MKIKQEEYDEINARCVDLSRQLKDTNTKKITFEKALKEIINLAERNTYGNDKLNLRKIKELASTAINH